MNALTDGTPSALTATPASNGMAPRAVAFFQRLAARRGVLAVGDQAIVSATNFATSVLLGRMCAESELGIYFLAVSTFYFVRGIQEQVLSGPYLVYSQREEQSTLPGYTGSLFVQQAGFVGVTLAGLAVAAGVLASGYGPQHFRSVLPVVAAVIPLMLLRDLLRQLTFASLNLPKTLVLDGVASTTQLMLLGGLALSGRLSAMSVFGAIGLSCLLASCVWFCTPTHPWQIEPRRLRADFQRNWTFGRWALASQLIGCSMPYVMPWIVATTDGEDAAGVLGASGTLVGIANMFVLGICNFLSPRATRALVDGGVRELRSVLTRTAILFLGTLGPFCVATALAGGPILSLVYGRTFPGGELILFLLSVNMLANSLGMVAGNGLWALERPAANFKADLAALVATLLAICVLAPMYGAMGTVGSTVFGTTVGSLVRLATLRMAMRSVTSPADERSVPSEC
ncbi:MAG: lipopolysaccharide biosynthesis protein [Planctomycetaceae bacterium]|nr:lipopolysaccharide biosynthesis protein [Planctomycetaceae bacterium]